MACSVLHQSLEGVRDYNELSEFVQLKNFEQLITKVNIERGWKILEFGCGTGRNAALLADKVGEKGKVIATDPIEERIQFANQNLKKQNLEFHVASAADCPKFGEGEFDLILSNYVMHWIPKEEKLSTFQQVWKALKPGGLFIFVTLCRSEKADRFFDLLPQKLKSQIGNSIFIESADLYESIALNSGFHHISIDTFTSKTTFKTYEDLCKFTASSLHTCNYKDFLEVLVGLPGNGNDVSFIYDENNKVNCEDTIQMFYGRKKI